MLVALFRKPLTVGHGVMLLLAAGVFAVAATSIASIPGPDGTIKSCIKKRSPKKGAVRVISHNKRCARSERTLTWSQTGPQGTPGAPGTPGTAGPQGTRGPAGSSDTGAQILAKLAPVDGSGSGLDADRLGGRPSGDFPRQGVSSPGARPSALALAWSYYNFGGAAAGTEFDVGQGFIHVEAMAGSDFRVCARNNTAAGYNVPFVVRIADAAPDVGSLASATGTTETCSTTYNPTSGREFSIHVQGAYIVGTPLGGITSNAPVADRWRLIAFAF
jgi:hypothetical protein